MGLPRFPWLDAEPADVAESSERIPDTVEMRLHYEGNVKALRSRIEKLKLRKGTLTEEDSDELQALEEEITALEEELSALHDMLSFA